MKWQKLRQAADSLLRQSMRTTHSRIVTCGLLLVGLGYLPFRLGDMVLRSLKGNATILMLAVFCLGLHQLWMRRHQLAKLEASDEDRFIGHAIILSGVALFPLCLSSIWSQTLLCLLILAAVACSIWGAVFFRKHPLPVFLIAAGLVPNPGVVARAFWETFVPPLMLERFTAWLGFLALRAIGQPAKLLDTIIEISDGAVEVTWGCTGFNMALSVAVAGLVLGLFFKQSFNKIVTLMMIGTVLALILNVPRMVLLALAQVYWGESSFHFWHDGWGAQIFSMVLFTVYYYIAMPILKRKPTESLT
jgi:exosortase/archaeosortase family protein